MSNTSKTCETGESSLKLILWSSINFLLIFCLCTFPMLNHKPNCHSSSRFSEQPETPGEGSKVNFSCYSPKSQDKHWFRLYFWMRFLPPLRKSSKKLTKKLRKMAINWRKGQQTKAEDIFLLIVNVSQEIEGKKPRHTLLKRMDKRLFRYPVQKS